MRLLIVTPIHNERSNIEALVSTVCSSTRLPDCWVVVDDGSTDGGRSLIADRQLPFEFHVVGHENVGGLIGGAAFKAWQFGIEWAVNHGVSFDAVMKLDADVELPRDYLARALSELESDAGLGLVGGVLEGFRDREQVLQIAGPVKMYSLEGFRSLDVLPRAVGFDIMDEHAIKDAGLRVKVMKDLHFRVRRAIGASEGRVHGRRRNGLVCKWTGYWGPYFALHALRAAFRAPYLVGAAAMVVGFVTADGGPYPTRLVERNKEWQKEKLRSAARHPISWTRQAYGIDER
jgi:glycosyltransferase involved in cell wall biosynthesis